MILDIVPVTVPRNPKVISFFVRRAWQVDERFKVLFVRDETLCNLLLTCSLHLGSYAASQKVAISIVAAMTTSDRTNIYFKIALCWLISKMVHKHFNSSVWKFVCSLQHRLMGVGSLEQRISGALLCRYVRSMTVNNQISPLNKAHVSLYFLQY